MKKLLILLVLFIAAALTDSALAEDAEPDAIRGEIVDGSYVFRIPINPDDSGEWVPDAEFTDEPVVRLASAGIEDSALVVRYEPVQDGTVTVNLRHYNGYACDAVHGFELLVAGGSIQEVTGGSYTEAPSDEDLDPYLSGKWLEKDTQFTEMMLSKDPESGWDAEITSPLTHGGYVFRATLHYDCEVDAFVYQDGALFNLPADTDGTVPAEDPDESRLSGSLYFDGNDEEGALFLCWPAEHNPESRDILLQPAEGPDGPQTID